MLNLKKEEFVRYLGFFIPSVFSFLFVWLLKDLALRADFIQNCVSALLIIVLLSFINNQRIRFYASIIALFAIHLLILVELTHHYLYKSPISASSIFIIIETNQEEAKEYLSTYIDTNLIFAIIFLIINFIYNTFLLKRQHTKSQENSWFTSSFRIGRHNVKRNSLVLLLILGITISYSKIRPFTLLNSSINGYIAYKKDMLNYQKFSIDKEGGKFTNLSTPINKQREEIYVLVIGESTARSHMSIYGYQRSTNPKLEKIKQELIVYKDVISPNAHTIPSLSKVLTFADHTNNDNYKLGSIVQLFNKAGFKTYWLSNQKPSGLYDTFVTAIANSADERYFTNTSGSDATAYDDDLLKLLKKQLSEPEDKKFIVLHLYGTHGVYANRYPKEFSVFDDVPITKFQHKEAYEYINTYDNAILFNDYVVSEVIKEVNSKKASSYVLYFSDHGEDVFETVDGQGHTDLNASKPMFDIPFVLWMSEKYRNTSSRLHFDATRKYSSEDLLFTLADLSNLKFDEFDATKSIVSPEFKFKQRIIIDTSDYDKKFMNYEK